MPQANKPKTTGHTKSARPHNDIKKHPVNDGVKKTTVDSSTESNHKSAGTSKTEQDQNIKTIAALAYLIFFLPLLTNKDSKFAMYHANQGLVLLLSFIVLNIVFTFLGTILFFFGGFLLWSIPGLVSLVLGVIGIMNALNGEMKPLPIIGEITLLK